MPLRRAWAPGRSDSPFGQGEGVHHPSRPCSVERGARRLARHVRERLPKVIPGHQPGAIFGFYLMGGQGPPANAGEREALRREIRRSRLHQNGCAAIRERCKSLGGIRTTVPHGGTNRVKGSTGSFNACWRREPGGGDTDLPEADHFRGSAQTADREKLNDERGVKPLPVNRSRDGAEPGTIDQDG